MIQLTTLEQQKFQLRPPGFDWIWAAFAIGVAVVLAILWGG